MPSGPPQSVNQVSVTSTTIRLRWELPLPEDRNGEIVGYSVRITSLETSEMNVQFVLNKELELTGLRPFITYSLVVAAQTAVGIGPYSRIILVQTLEDGELLSIYGAYSLVISLLLQLQAIPRTLMALQSIQHTSSFNGIHLQRMQQMESLENTGSMSQRS